MPEKSLPIWAEIVTETEGEFGRKILQSNQQTFSPEGQVVLSTPISSANISKVIPNTAVHVYDFSISAKCTNHNSSTNNKSISLTHFEPETQFDSHTVCTCTECGEEFVSQKALTHHQRTAVLCKLKFECDICHKTFSRQRNVRRHKSSYHRVDNDSYKCDICSITFNILSLWKGHMKSAHLVYEHVECTICQKLCLGPNKLKKHMKSMHPAPETKHFVCPTCQKVFKTKTGFKSHQINHEKNDNLCEICGKSVKGIYAMKTHMRNEHSKKGTFTCKICNHQFDMEFKLFKHRRQQHKKRWIPGPAYCEICGKKYKSSEILKKHRLIHFDDKPFKCDICNATFKQQVTLRTHQRVHSSVGKYFCDGCGLSFKWKGTFDRHVRNCEAIESERNSAD